MFPVSIKGVLQSPEGLVVLMLNERDEWELPGGRIELGETAPQCLAREIAEELAVEVSVGEPLDSYLFEVIPGKHVFISTYRCQLLGGFVPTISHEHKEIGLFAPEQLPVNLPAGYRLSIIKALRL
ncbi:NUDIX hydrolase [Pseudomonas thivervalensis]|uniref:NUDIX hydrolase n=1 Tax=Pseudomonas thivervalensis TaxID=86265 RepID=A0A176NNU0_9PSED|nr:NUDIX domain-containing protein [Pseudomonas thivervalensis]AXA55943.1 NUDIX hydrolase [Pseudomonas thivervalensis]AXA61760.1 NUDIX hydrolase [Pseudomonas thivervalensis]OAB52717.1 NUDIX hydrolase [Pseudomonas thivervalensis]SDG21896.1 ADP-ribose pyrophosphatase YjhB, NUDIX family [Pseudomonas thivervalensis]